MGSGPNKIPDVSERGVMGNGRPRPGPTPRESVEARAQRLSQAQQPRGNDRAPGPAASRPERRPSLARMRRESALRAPQPRPTPGPGPRRAPRAPVHAATEPAPKTIDLDVRVDYLSEQGSPAEQRRAAMSFAAIFLAVIAIGVVASVFQTDAEAASAPDVEVLGAIELPTTTAPPTTLAPTTTTVAPTTTTTTAAPTTTTTTTTIPLAERELSRIERVFGNIAPKSVTATGTGLFFAQNMMYRHSVTVYDDQGELLRTIDDEVDLAAFGIEGGVVARGAPVEAAATSDGSQVYVSNYAMYGPGFGPEPDDGCNDTGWDNSFLYRVNAENLEIDQVIEVGAVPKFLAVTPDDRFVVVANWCSFDVSIVDTASGVEVSRIDIGRHPRGIAITRDSSTAYITEQGGSRIAVIDLDAVVAPPTTSAIPVGRDWGAGVELEWIEDVGSRPRSLVLSPGDDYLYATLNGAGEVVKIDLSTNEVVATVRTGDAPRSMAISVDGEALYVVNYNSDTMSKVLTDTMEEVQELRTAEKPIGITVDPITSNVWVSNYSGVLEIYEDQ